MDDWEEGVYLDRLEDLGSTLDEFITTPFNTEVLTKTWTSLHAYQHEGCKWMYRLYQTGVGGILGDEMGLGKTAQLCTHFGSLGRPRESPNGIFLILCPATLLRHWLKEMHRWSPELRTVILHEISSTGSDVARRTEKFVEASLRRLQHQSSTRGLVVITSYEGLRKHKETFQRIEWTAVCLDEGQRLKNPATLVTQIRTPIQNSLKELWSIFDFVYPGRLGSLSTFEIEFAMPIRAGGYTTATKLQVEIATQTATTLQRIVRPYILRRKKEDMQDIIQLPKKTEQILFCRLSQKQSEVYDLILSSSEVKAVLQRKISSFRALSTLRKLCNHPDLVYHRGDIIWQQDASVIDKSQESRKRKLAKESHNQSKNLSRLKKTQRKSHSDSEDEVDSSWDSDEEDILDRDDHQDDVSVTSEMPSNAAWNDSGKLVVLSKILPLWRKQGHKVLIFSQMRSMLNLVEYMMNEFKFRYLRLDGSTTISKRSSIIDQFNQDNEVFAILLTTRTGGLGISLTAANRVLLLDPDWNPMSDIQARERSWRIGQTREVTIYRLISRGTIEEKIYQRQIFKILLSKRILENPKQKNLFSKTFLKELFERSDEQTPSITISAERQTTSGGIDNDLPAEGEVILRDNITANDEYMDMIKQSKGIEGPDEEFDDAFDDSNVELEAKDTVLKYRQLAASADELDEEEDDNDDYSIEEMKVEAKKSRSSSSSSSSRSQQNNSSQKKLSQNQNEEQSSVTQDKKLLEALFSGDAITGVYDHNFVEDTSSSNNANRYRGNSIEDVAARTVQEAMNRVVASSGRIGNVQASGASVLSAIRDRQAGIVGGGNQSNSSQSQPSTNRLSIREDIETRLKALFEGNPYGMPSDRILAHFPDLHDHHAPLFKQILKSLANNSNGVWKIKIPH